MSELWRAFGDRTSDLIHFARECRVVYPLRNAWITVAPSGPSKLISIHSSNEAIGGSAISKVQDLASFCDA